MRTGYFLIGLSIAACTPYDPVLPATPFLCGAMDPQCPDGYACVAQGGKMVCAKSAGDDPDGGVSGTCAMAFDGVLASWDLTGAPGTQGSTNAATFAPGITASAISRAPALSPSAASGSISASNWPMGTQLDTMSFFTISVTPPSGCAVAPSSLTVDAKSSNTGPTMAAVGTSDDAFAQTVSIATTAPSMPALTGMTVSALEIRIYGYSATATGGTFRIQNILSLTGKLK